MKFFSWLAAILIVLLIIAAVTAPNEKRFIDFINRDKGGDTMSCKPIIGATTQVKVLVKIFSVNRVTYCEGNQTPMSGGRLGLKNKRSGSRDSTNTLKMIVPGGLDPETYLGLFGRFWKI